MTLLENSCSKVRVRVARAMKFPAQPEFHELAIDIQIEGDVESENLPRVTAAEIRNVVYGLAENPDFTDPEAFGILLGRELLDRYRQVLRVVIHLAAANWHREGRSAFIAGGPHQRTSRVTTTRDRKIVESGVAGYLLLKMPVSKDQSILATSLGAVWHYRNDDISWTPSWHGVMKLMAATFAEHDSSSDQDTLYTIGEAVLAQCDHVSRIRLTMPHRHYPPCGVAGASNIFCPTDESGETIEASLAR